MTDTLLRHIFESTDRKTYFQGTERCLAPSETFERVRPFMQSMGITRLAELTGLDTIGVPTFQAVRPMARSLSVNQGKGVDPMAARVSALMESAETWHAENPHNEVRRGSRRDLAALGRCLDLVAASSVPHLSEQEIETTELSWVAGFDLVCGDPIWVPTDCVFMDYSKSQESRFLQRTSNGLASGNTLAEAAVSALLEVIERDCTADFKAMSPAERLDCKVRGSEVRGALDPKITSGLANGNALVEVWDITNDIGVPAYYAVLQGGVSPHSGKLLRGFAGAGCHLNPIIALSRAVTEAVQSRLTVIAGSRDDLTPEDYEPPKRQPIEMLTSVLFEAEQGRPMQTNTMATQRPSDDLRLLISQIQSVGCREVALVNLTHEDKGIPVVRVVAPGLGHAVSKGEFVRGVRRRVES